jgi:hypothetical protein
LKNEKLKKYKLNLEKKILKDKIKKKPRKWLKKYHIWYEKIKRKGMRWKKIKKN